MTRDGKDKREKAAYITAIISFIAGWGLTIAGFCVSPVGEVSNSVLAILGEALIYAASVFGVTLYFSNQMQKFKRETRAYLDGKARENSEETNYNEE